MNEKLSPERLAEIRTRRDEGLECHDGYHVCETWVPEARQLLWSWSSIRGVGTCVENDIPALLAHIAAVEAERDALAATIARVNRIGAKYGPRVDAVLRLPNASEYSRAKAEGMDFILDEITAALFPALGATAQPQPKDGEQR